MMILRQMGSQITWLVMSKAGLKPGPPVQTIKARGQRGCYPLAVQHSPVTMPPGGETQVGP